MAGFTVTRRGVAERVSSVQPRPGLYLPPDWGQWWKAARAGSGSSLARIGIMGDSAARGYYSSNLNTKGWAALLTSALQAKYGDGGSGFRGVGDTQAGMSAAGVATAAQTAYASQEVGVTGAGWAFKGDVGPGSVAMYSSTAGNTLTFTVRGTSVTVYYEKQTTGFANPTWTIDGVAQTALNGTGTNGSYATTVSGLSAGSHTVVITAGSGGGFTSIYGVAGTNSAGVVLHNFSKFGAASAQFVGSTYKDVAAWSGGASNPCDLLIYELGAADVQASVAVDTWVQNVGFSLNAVRSGSSPQTDILLLRNHIGENIDSANAPVWGNYGARLRGIAETYGAAIIDLWRLGRNSWAYWNALGYWSDATGSGASGTDNIHPGDTGHAYIASQVLPLLI